MKASELVEQLQELIKDYGDLNLYVMDPEYGSEEAVVKVEKKDGLFLIDVDV